VTANSKREREFTFANEDVKIGKKDKLEVLLLQAFM